MWHGIELNFIGLLANLGLISEVEAERRVQELASKMMGSRAWAPVAGGHVVDFADVPVQSAGTNPQDDPTWAVNAANTADASNVANMVNGPLTRD